MRSKVTTNKTSDSSYSGPGRATDGSLTNHKEGQVTPKINYATIPENINDEDESSMRTESQRTNENPSSQKDVSGTAVLNRSENIKSSLERDQGFMQRINTD